jgi:site-specific recombinase XerD
MKFEMDELAYKEIYNEYLSWLSEKLQLANLTIRIRSSHIKQFLQWYKETSNYQALQQITPYDVELFFIKATSRLGVSTTGLLKVVLRSFFDFCHEQGYTTQNLRYSIPVIRTYQLSDIPKKIEDHEALKLIDSIDRSTVNGKRTYAILLLLYTYGVRGCQIRSLKVKDIDWHKEEIHFHSVKNSKSLCFPLTSNVGNALFEYLKYARKKCQYKEFFLTLCAPVKPLEAWGISQIVRRSMVKVGIKSPSKGAHCFRHGFVSRMLKQGESFKNISDLLGHKHIKTTFIYTKIDFNSLSEVALQLPEVDNENV